LRDEAGDDIHRRAGGERVDEAQRPVGPGGLLGERGRGEQGRRGGEQVATKHGGSPLRDATLSVPKTARCQAGTARRLGGGLSRAQPGVSLGAQEGHGR
jgi:hypothetical protein